VSDQTLPDEQQAEPQPRKGLFARHPRLGILVIGALFILPLCAMVAAVAVFIALQALNA
jgi:hypothetical protein